MEYLNIAEVAPVKTFFVRQENGYKIYRSKKNETEIVLRAPRYRKVSADYNPRGKAIDFTKLTDGLQNYETLKSRIVQSSLKFGAVFAVIAAAAVDVETACFFLRASPEIVGGSRL